MVVKPMSVDLSKLIREGELRKRDRKDRFQRESHKGFPVWVVDAEAGQRMFVHDKQRRVLAYLFPIPPHLMEILETSHAALLPRAKPRLKPKGNAPVRSQARSPSNVIRHYAVWAKYSTHRYHNKEYLDDRPHSEDFIDKNSKLFQDVSDVLKFLVPDDAVLFQNMQEYDGEDDRGQSGDFPAKSVR